MRSMKCFDLKKLSPIWRGLLLVLGGLVVLGLVVWALWCIPPWQVEQVRVRLDKPEKYEYRLATLEDEYRRTLAQSIGGFFLLVGLYLTWRRIVATEKNVSVAEEGQITERFTRAIAQLGDKEMAIRLGGIYALERIAKDSEKDHGPIMEVLTAYVREKATKQGKYAEEAAKKPTTDIQAILTVIGRRKTVKAERVDDFLDLRNTHLAGAKLIDANLSEVILIDANLSGARLQGVILQEVILIWANLQGVDLSGVDLSGSKNLTAEQVRSADNWREATLPDDLQYLLTEPPA